MYNALQAINERPAPFAFYTAEELWTDEYTSEQMLNFHLNGEVDLSSYNSGLINRAIHWMTSRFEIGPGKTVIDFGCGPGLYTLRLARTGASVIGIDFSTRSLAYAKDAALKEGLTIEYVEQNYLAYETGAKADLILMIMRDFCVLDPGQRQRMLRKFASILKPGGCVLLDVDSFASFDAREECATYGPQQLDGFWSNQPYYGFLNTFKYEKEKLVLDKYVVVEPDRQRTICNWMQCFSPDTLAEECTAAGLTMDSLHGSIAGDEYDPDATSFAAILRKA